MTQSEPLIVNVVVRILKDEFFAAESSFGVILLQDVQLTQFQPEIRFGLVVKT